MTETHDLVITMKTGGGKSMLWMVPPVLDEAEKCIVVCPYVALLQEQYTKTAATGLHCHDYTASKEVPENVQGPLCAGGKFLLVSPLGKKFTRFYVDEVHDVLNCHPERAPKWLTLGHQFSKAEPFGIKKSEINEVRSSTNRPEIGIHVVQVEPIAARESLHHLVRTLSNLLGDNDRMLVFFSSQGETEDFSRKARCALYHSDLWEAGNTKAYNLDLWDRGASKVMSCTTAFAQGMDRSNVRYVVIFRPAYGLIVNNQMMGRAGRDGKESHVFFVNDRHGASLFNTRSLRDTSMVSAWMASILPCCARRLLAESLATYVPPTAPSNGWPKKPLKILSGNWMPLCKRARQLLGQTLALQGRTSAAQPMPPGFVQASALLQTPTNVSEPPPARPSTQNSDSLYECESEITSSQALVLDAMEVIHGKVTGFHAI
ncbi:P-loop containing nucleoside triphosphate hydrolase protein [Suillus ampliporus]|nr:P-loop containing nucleoside triphosphate hydrolase protein [Suillus ampliporus]